MRSSFVWLLGSGPIIILYCKNWKSKPKLTLTTNKAAESYNSCCLCFGKGKYTKSDEFLEQFQGGGGILW